LNARQNIKTNGDFSKQTNTTKYYIRNNHYNNHCFDNARIKKIIAKSLWKELAKFKTSN
jgi:hypothetical protein